tara:strand:+ start:1093 stop:1935 length:843 start_codon:yes stop_codon:yes gene_type:complete
MAVEIFNRQAVITVGTLRLEGYRVTFKIRKTLEREPNTCEVQIFNLSAKNRAAVGELTPSKGAKRGIPVKIEGGYETTGGPQLLWLGDLRTSLSYKEGPTWVTSLSSGDGEKAQQTSRMGQSFGPRTPIATILKAIVGALGIGEGNISRFLGESAGNTGRTAFSGVVLQGSAAYHLDNWTRAIGASWSVQDGELQLLKDGTTATGRSVLLSPPTGLIGVPVVEADGNLSVTSFILPDVDIGGVVVVKSESVEGNFRIDQAEWVGDTRGQDWYVSIKGPRF